jgi:hypothetical protein
MLLYRGLSPAHAELKFLEIAKRLELYGSEVQKAMVRPVRTSVVLSIPLPFLVKLWPSSL